MSSSRQRRYDSRVSRRTTFHVAFTAPAATNGMKSSDHRVSMRLRAYRSSHVLIAADDPSELVPLEEAERRYVLRVVESVGGNKTLAARVLGIGRKTLYRKLVQYGASGE